MNSTNHSIRPSCLLAISTLFLLLTGNSVAEEIRFSTKDNNFSTKGSLAGYFLNGEAIEKPNELVDGLTLVIKKENGELTPPVPVSLLSSETLKIIGLVAEPPTKRRPRVNSKTKLFENHAGELNKLVEAYTALYDAGELPNWNSNHNLRLTGMSRDLQSAVRTLRRKVGSSGRNDAIFDFVMTFIECQLGQPKSGTILAIASKHDGHFEAWKAAIYMVLREKGANRAVPLLEKAKRHTVEFGQNLMTKEATPGVLADLDQVAEFGAWLLSTSESFRISNVSSSPIPGRLADDIDFKDFLSNLKSYESRKNERMRIDLAIATANMQQEESRKKQLAADADRKLANWEQNAEQVWNNGLLAFNLQSTELNRAVVAMQVTYRQVQRARSNVSSAKSEATAAESKLDSADTEDRINDAQSELGRANAKLASWETQLEIASDQYNECRYIKILQESKLRAIYQQLALFINESKNLAILFENYYLEAFDVDESLKAKWVDFTDRLKVTISQFPVMPTIATPQVNAREQQAKLERELLEKLEFDLGNFLDNLM